MDPDERARELVAQGYRSTSNKYRYVARLPPGKSAMEALQDCAPDEYRHIIEQLKQQCANRYRRIYASRHGDQLELTDEEFQAFKRAGGEVSW